MRHGLSQVDTPHELGKLSPQVEAKPQQVSGGKRKLWLADWQREAYNLSPRQLVITGGRGTGKTTFMALRVLQFAQIVVRGISVYLGVSQKQLQGKTVPALVKSLEQQYGIIEGVHFFRGQPPLKLRKQWPSPLTKPRTWENVIAWYTGAANFLISTSQTAAANGYNLCALFSDEYRFIDPSILFSDIYPALRGDSYYSPGWSKDTSPLYLSTTFMSDAGVTKKQRILQEKLEQGISEDEEAQRANNQVAEMLADLEICPELGQVDAFKDRLNRLRCKARMYLNYSSLENLSSLGEDYLRRLQLTMPPLLFQVQILGRRLSNLDNTGYYNYNPDVHAYLPNGDAQTDIIHSKMMRSHRMRNDGVQYDWESPDLEATAEHADDCTLDDDLDPHLPLRIAFDVGHDFNCIVVGQIDEARQPRTLKIIKAMFVKNGPRLGTLIKDFNRYYRYQRMVHPDIIVYTDVTLRQGAAYALDNSDDSRFANVIKKQLTGAGWKVHEVYLGTPMYHNQKYQYLGNVFSESDRLHVRINQEQCDFLCLAIEQCEAEDGPKGIRKCKRLEKYKSEDGVAGTRETRSDITDAMDTLIIGCGRYNLSGQNIVSGTLGGVFLTTPTIL